MGIAELLAILMSHGCPWEWHSSVPSAFRKHVLGAVWQLAGLIMFAIIFFIAFYCICQYFEVVCVLLLSTAQLLTCTGLIT